MKPVVFDVDLMRLNIKNDVSQITNHTEATDFRDIFLKMKMGPSIFHQIDVPLHLKLSIIRFSRE